MFPSIITRTYVFSAVIGLAVVTLAAGLLYTVALSRSGMHWLNHSASVLNIAGEIPALIHAADSGSRGFVLTGDPPFVEEFDAQVAAANRLAERLPRLTADNPAQQSAAQALQQDIAAHLQGSIAIVTLARLQQVDEARAAIAASGRLAGLQSINDKVRRFIAEERRLELERTRAVERQQRFTTILVVLGVGAILLALFIVARMIARQIRRPVAIMADTMSALANGANDARINVKLGSVEFDRLAGGFNRMADDLSQAVSEHAVTAEKLQEMNAALQDNAAKLGQRSQSIELLGNMAHRMQAARTSDELAAVVSTFVPRVLPDLPGVLYTYNNSRNLLTPVATWGGASTDDDGFAPDECWALRRGQSHSVGDPGLDIVCGHAQHAPSHYHCEPLLAAGEAIGIFHLRGDPTPEQRFSLAVLGENIASALVNHRLQRGLREQTIRDPLTGLFNRRYMEETLALEVARAARSNQPLSVIMCDVDHFKRFNDEFGHEAGDTVLSVIAAEMATRFRDGDVICRYGGEEFTIIAPGTSAQQLASRADTVRAAIAALHIRCRGSALGSTTMSFGIATWTPAMDREGVALVAAADRALYRAKREGRNRVVVDMDETEGGSGGSHVGSDATSNLHAIN